LLCSGLLWGLGDAADLGWGGVGFVIRVRECNGWSVEGMVEREWKYDYWFVFGVIFCVFELLLEVCYGLFRSALFLMVEVTLFL